MSCGLAAEINKTAKTVKLSFRLWAIRVIPLSGDLTSTAHLEVSKFFCCTIQINVSLFAYLIQFT